MDLQGTEAGREIENTLQPSRVDGSLQPFHKGVRAKTQIEIEFGWPVFDQQILVPSLPVHKLYLSAALGDSVEQGFDRAFGTLPGFECFGNTLRATKIANGGVLKFFLRKRLLNGHAAKPHGIAWLKLAQLPQFGLNDGRGADKTAQARTVRPEYHRHIAREVHAADGVGVIVDVGRMKAGFAPVAARPLRFRTEQARPASAGVVMHFPLHSEKSSNILFRE